MYKKYLTVKNRQINDSERSKILITCEWKSKRHQSITVKIGVYLTVERDFSLCVHCQNEDYNWQFWLCMKITSKEFSEVRVEPNFSSIISMTTMMHMTIIWTSNGYDRGIQCAVSKGVYTFKA